MQPPRKKGKWTGGTVPLGYDAKDKKLVINKTEAQTVRTIFKLYLELRSFGKLVAELDRRRIVTKRRDTKVAKYQGGIPFTYGPLAYFLKNRIYLGEIHHGGKWFKGEHAAILDRQTFDRVQQLLKENNVRRGAKFSESGRRHTLRETPRSRRNPQWRNATRAGNEVVGEHVERVERRCKRAPQQDSGQRQEEPRALEQHTDCDKTADDSWLHHQRCIETLAGVRRLEALLENEPEV